MSSTATPLKRQRSVKFHIDESTAKPSIKITVSSDTIAETLLKNVVVPSSNIDDDTNEELNGEQQPALIQIVGNCCSNKNDAMGGNGVKSPSSPVGVLCSCANGEEKRTRIALDDYTVLEFPNCIDFGIKDFLCCKDEIELDLSSDTDASFLDATPPHRFSDSELENQIEAMSITLDTQLNPFPNQSPFIMSGNENEEEEEQTTEESFIMDEEEASSSASNSAATICGDVGANLDDFEEQEYDNQFPINSSNDLLVQGEFLQKEQRESISLLNEAEKVQSINEMANNDRNGASSPPFKRSHEAFSRKMGDTNGSIVKEHERKASYQNSDSKGLSGSVDESKNAPKADSRKMMKHPTKHFKRQISLPASIFMTYLLEQNNKGNYYKHNNHLRHQQHNNYEIIAKNKLNRSNSCKHPNKSNTNEGGIVIALQPSAPLTPSKKLHSYRSSKVICGSTEDYEEDEMINNSNSFSDTNEDYLAGSEERDEMLLGCENSKWSSAWESKSDSFTNTNEANNDGEDPHELEFDDEQQAFTSEVEKRSLILRHVRRLIRQDTTGNFAPPDFSI